MPESARPTPARPTHLNGQVSCLLCGKILEVLELVPAAGLGPAAAEAFARLRCDGDRHKNTPDPADRLTLRWAAA